MTGGERVVGFHMNWPFHHCTSGDAERTALAIAGCVAVAVRAMERFKDDETLQVRFLIVIEQTVLVCRPYTGGHGPHPI